MWRIKPEWLLVKNAATTAAAASAVTTAATTTTTIAATTITAATSALRTNRLSDFGRINNNTNYLEQTYMMLAVVVELRTLVKMAWVRIPQEARHCSIILLDLCSLNEIV